MNLLKKARGLVKDAWDTTKELARKALDTVVEKGREVATAIAVGFGFVAGTSSAQAADTDYSAVLTTNLTSIQTIWGTVATIMIAVALVTVGVRFFRKAK